MKTKHISILLIVLLLSMSLITFGADTFLKIQATMAGDMKFLVDGKSWSPKDVDGSALTPLLYNGRTYLPVKALLEEKGVTIGYEADTKTVLIDYSTFNMIDKTSPVLIEDVVMGTGSGAGKATFKEFTITRNRDLSVNAFPRELVYSFDLADNAVIMVDGKPVDMTVSDLAKSGMKWTMGDRIKLGHDTALGDTIRSIELSTTSGVGQGEALASKVTVTIEISGPPLRIKITIKF